MYALLIVAWRTMLASWGQRLDGWSAARIWTVSSLGKYLPGKVWAVAGMALMSQRAGIAAVGRDRLGGRAPGARDRQRGGGGRAHRPARPRGGASGRRGGARACSSLGAVAGVALLLWPPFLRAAAPARRARSRDARGAAGGSGIVFGIAANLIAWVGYGAALWLLARGLLPSAGSGSRRSRSRCSRRRIWRASWRCSPPAGSACARDCSFSCCRARWASAPRRRSRVASRVLLTITEFGAAVPFLVFPQGRARVAP